MPGEEMEKLAMWKVLSIDQIVERCNGNGINCVVSVDAPLVTALNARVKRPLFGYAFTPRRIAESEATAVIGTTPDSDLEVCRKIMHITRFPLRFTHSTVKRIRDIRRFVHEPAEYLTGREKEVYEAYRQTYPVDCIMDSYGDGDLDRFYDSRVTAVVDLQLFSSIDKKMIPIDHEPVSNDTLEDGHDGTYTIPRIYSIGNDRQIADCVAALITPENCNDVAIVLDSGGSIAEAVRSALYRGNIPFKNELAVKDLSAVRDFIRFMDAALDYATIRAGDVRELFSTYGAKSKGGLTTRVDGYLLSRLTPEQIRDKEGNNDARTLELMDIMKRIHGGEMTFNEAADALPGQGRGSVKMLLRDMHVGDGPVDRTTLTDIEYAVNNIDDLKHNEQIPDDERRGVLLADCKNSVYIDRPLVFFIGLDDAWHNSPTGKDYIRDPLEFETREAMRLRILLQQGDRRIYIIRPATGGKETIPCQTFQRIEDMQKEEMNMGRAPEDALPILQIKSFSDICGEVVSGSWYSAAESPAQPVTDRACGASFGQDVVFSKSEYNAWSDCPYKFIFKKVITDDYEENNYALFGTYIHEFAELAFCFPELAAENFEKYMQILIDLYSGISNRCMSELDRSKFKTVMVNVLTYIYTIRPAGLELDEDNSGRKYPNLLIAAEPLTGNRCSSMAEMYIDSVEGHMTFAKPDLVLGNDMYDWKTGKAKSPKDILAGFGKKGERHEWQPLIYLKVLQERVVSNGGSLPVRFNLVYFAHHVAEAVRRVVSGNGSMEDNVRTIELIDCTDESLLEDYGFDEIYASLGSSYSKFLNNWDSVKSAVLRCYGKGDWTTSEATVDAVLAATGMSGASSNRDKVKTFLKKFPDYSQGTTIAGNKIYVTTEYLDRFIADLDAASPEARRVLEIPLFTKTRDEAICDRCDYRSACLSVLAEDYEGGEGEE